MENQYPIDFDSLKKGDVFSIGQLERILGKKRDTVIFRFAVLGLQARIQSITQFTVKTNERELRVLTDAEASEHNRRMYTHHLGGLYNRHRLNCAVDVTNLVDTQRLEHERTLISQGRYLSAVTNVTKQISAADGRSLPAVRQRKKSGDGGPREITG